MNVAYRVETERLVLRCWQPSDAPKLKAAVDASLEHLRPFMPWIENEPEPVEEKVQRLRLFRAAFDRDDDYIYGVFNKDESEVWGGCGLHKRRGPGVLEIGYWIHADHIGKGLATELSGALTDVAFEIFEVDRVEIRCGDHNRQSARIPEKLGFIHEGSLRDKVGFETENTQRQKTMVWAMFSEEHKTLRNDVSVFDVIERQI